MAVYSDALGGLMTHEQFDQMILIGRARNVGGAFGEYLKIFHEDVGLPGRDSYDVKCEVPPALPTERASLYTTPTQSQMKLLPTRSLSYTAYRDFIPMSTFDLMNKIRNGTFQATIDRLLGLCYQRVISDMASAIDAIHSTSGALIVSSMSGSGTDALAATHTLLDGSSTWDNSLTGALTSDSVASMFETMSEEVNPNNVKTLAIPKVLWCGSQSRREALQAVYSVVSSGAMQYNVNQGMDVALLPGMTSTDFGMCDGPKPGGPTIAWAGGLQDIPPELAGRGIEFTSGVPSVSPPVYDPVAQVCYIAYGCTYAIGAASNEGWIASTGA